MINSIQSTLMLEPTINNEKFAELVDFLTEIKGKTINKEQLAFVCIGTDRSTGDSLGPLVGNMLKGMGFEHVYGTLENPCDADHVQKTINSINDTQKLIVAIDACLGQESSIGSFILSSGPLIPGAGVGRTLPAIGHYSIAAVVNKRGLKSYWQLQNTSLLSILRMVYTLELAIKKVWGD